MNDIRLFTLWGVLFALCAALSLIPNPENLLGAVCFLCGIAFFVPPFLLLHRAKGNRSTLRLLASVSLLSLVLTLLLIITNFFTVRMSAFWGNLLHGILAVVSVPMFCCRYWVLSLFLWALLMTSAFRLLRKK